MKAREYWIHAYTYCELSGYCFKADVHVVFLPDEFNRVLFTFRSTGNVQLPCYISNPAGVYTQSRYDMYPASLEPSSAYVWHGPCYNPERGLEFTISYAYNNLISDIQPDEMELSVTASDGLHIMKFTFNLMDIVTHQRPLELIVEEVPTGTIGYSGEFEFEKREISIDLKDGDVVNFPLEISGTATGMNKVFVKIFKGEQQLYGQIVNVVESAFSDTIDSLSANEGDNLIITIYDWEHMYNADNALEYDSVSVDVVYQPAGDIVVSFTGETESRATCGDSIIAANFKIAASTSYFLEEATLEVPHGSAQAISGVYLFNEAYCLNEANSFMTEDSTTITGMNFQISPNLITVLRVEYRLRPVGSPTGVSSGLNLRTILDSIVLRDSDGDRKTVDVRAVGNEIYVYRSYPVVTQIPLSTEEKQIVNGNLQTIYKWKMEASSCGAIAIKQMPKIKTTWKDLGVPSDLQFRSLRVFRGTEDITKFVKITNQDGKSVKTDVLAEADNSILISFLPEEIIAGGATLFYTLKATPENFDHTLDGADMVALNMMGDNHSGNKRYCYCDNGIWKLAEDNAGANAENFNFLWSDRSELSHCGLSGMSTGDWFNGYLIKNLPLDPVVLDENP